jgi:dTDP-4-amino-4,6-dideoxygalactose transaminase
MKPIPLVDLVAQYQSIKRDVDQAIAGVLKTQQFRLGPKVAEFEEKLAAYTQTRFACGVSSGTDALLMALMAEGIGSGDEVITSAQSFIATPGAITRVGAKPVFVDIEPVAFSIDPKQIESKITKKTKAIIPVHLYGQTAEMDPILAVAKKHGLVVIEDAAQAIGAEYKDRCAGSMGAYGCISFFPAKNLGAFGDGGAIITSDQSRFERLKSIREHGQNSRAYEHAALGGNFRLDALQAAVLTAKLKHLDGWNEKRAENAKRYDTLFIKAGLVSKGYVRLPETKQTRHVFHQYVVRAKRRDDLASALQKAGIACGVYYPIPLPFQPCFSELGHKKGDFPHAEKVSEETLALPIYPELTDAQAAQIVATISQFFQ